MVIVYTDGVFDLFHYGHSRSLEQAKKVFPDVYLKVGICKDEDVWKHKGPTVMTYEERCKCVSHCKWIDEIIYDAPWVIDEEFLIKETIDFVARENDPYITTNGDGEIVEDAYIIPKKLNKFVEIYRTNGISTTDLISRVLNNYDLYNSRNIKRNP
jgi:choline-phosphate cytidylyltransferase